MASIFYIEKVVKPALEMNKSHQIGRINLAKQIHFKGGVKRIKNKGLKSP